MVGVTSGKRTSIYGYFANPDKLWLVVKEDKYNEAKEIFHNTNVNITKEGRHYLGSALGNDSFIEAFAQNKVVGWVKKLRYFLNLQKPNHMLPLCVHALYKWSFILRTTPGNSELLQPVEDAILFRLLPSLTGRDAFSLLGEGTHGSASSPRRIRNSKSCPSSIICIVQLQNSL